jgi:hypothetical protein
MLKRAPSTCSGAITRGNHTAGRRFDIRS